MGGGLGQYEKAIIAPSLIQNMQQSLDVWVACPQQFGQCIKGRGSKMSHFTCQKGKCRLGKEISLEELEEEFFKRIKLSENANGAEVDMSWWLIEET